MDRSAQLLLHDAANLDAFARPGGLVLLLSWYYSIGKSQQTYVKEGFGKA
jgi:hypothetical protein